jgi:hypothetical protein
MRDYGPVERQKKVAALINGAPVELAARLPGILFANATSIRTSSTLRSTTAGYPRSSSAGCG